MLVGVLHSGLILILDIHQDSLNLLLKVWQVIFYNAKIPVDGFVSYPNT